MAPGLASVALQALLPICNPYTAHDTSCHPADSLTSWMCSLPY